MGRYVKRPIPVEAVKFEDNVECFDKLRALGMDPVVDYVDKDTPVILIDTLEGEHVVGRVGDYIIRGVKGEFYPCRKDVFEETYEEADATGGWKERFKAEYRELSNRIDKLSAMLEKYKAGTLEFTPNCSYEKLQEQLIYMQLYQTVLEDRADIERIDITND